MNPRTNSADEEWPSIYNCENSTIFGTCDRTYDVGTAVNTMKKELMTYSCRIKIETNKFATAINPNRFASAPSFTHRAIRMAMLAAKTTPKSLRYSEKIWCRILRTYFPWVLSGRGVSWKPSQL